MLNKEKVVFNVELSSNYIRCLQCFNINTIFCKAMVRRVSKIQKIIWEKNANARRISPQAFITWRAYWVPEDRRLFFYPLELVVIRMNARLEVRILRSLNNMAAAWQSFISRQKVQLCHLNLQVDSQGPLILFTK